jgi:hypothetical protein
MRSVSKVPPCCTTTPRLSRVPFMTFFLPITNTKGLPLSRELSNCLSFNSCSV